MIILLKFQIRGTIFTKSTEIITLFQNEKNRYDDALLVNSK